MLKNVLQKLSLEDQRIPVDIQVPDDFCRSLLLQLLERDYLSDASDMRFLNVCRGKPRIHWMQITRLPVHPNENESYDLLSRWQGVLSSLHAWGYRLYFLLLRSEGRSKLFLGTVSSARDITGASAIEQLREAARGSMPGIGLRVYDDEEDGKEHITDEILLPLQSMKEIGAVTGIPSFQAAEKKGFLQTLDRLAFGIRDSYDNEKNFAMLVIADPISDREITDIISRYRNLGTQIHTAVKRTVNTSDSRSESFDPMAKEKAKTVLKGSVLGMGVAMLGTIIGAMAGSVLCAPAAGAQAGINIAKLIGHALSAGGLYAGAIVGNQAANVATADMTRTTTDSSSSGLSIEYLDKFAEFAESATEHQIKRLNEGRNFGFWNTGVYVMAELPVDVKTVTGMLRSIYSGEETYYEPIRLHLFRRDSRALEIVRNHFDLIPMLDAGLVKPEDGFDYTHDQWHLLGRNYQYLSTPITTRELSLATSLPRRDVPGLRFVKTAVRFASNPAEVLKDRIELGKIVDTGIVQDTSYCIDVHSLVRHALVSGSTGSGKSTTCKKVLQEVMKRDIPVMVIEPAKDDYVRWAIDMNSHIEDEDKRFKIYMPGATEFEGTPVEDLRMNLFEPAHAEGAMVDLLQHSEITATLLNACLPSEDVVPILIEETVYETIEKFVSEQGGSLDEGPVPPLKWYPPMLELQLNAKAIMEKKNYENRVKENFKEVLDTRFKSLRRGMRGRVLDVLKSVDYHALFNGNVIINISRFSGTKDKALIMSLLMQALYEYRASRYSVDKAYRERAQNNELLHLALIEEAHNLLLKPGGNQSSGSPQRAAADLFGNMLSEVRSYGQGFVVVDQVPTRLIDDVIKNTNYKIVHRLTAPDDQAVMASCMALREEQKYIIPALEIGDAIICGDRDDAAVWVRIPKA